MRRLIHSIPKPILFGLLGALGCLAGWAAGEPLLKTLKPASAPEDGGAPARESAPVLVFNNEMQRRLQREEAKTGDVQISLIWDNVNDLDLHCVDPSGERIFYNHKRAASGGELDVDMNAREPLSSEPVENIFWPPAGAPKGRYQVFVNHYAVHASVNRTDFTVGLKQGGKVREIKGFITQGETRPVVEFEAGGEPEPQSLVARGVRRQQVDFKTVVVLGLWTALLAICASAMLVVGQNFLLRRRLLSLRQAGLVLGGGVSAGLVSGAVSQYLFAFGANVFAEIIVNAQWILKIGQVFGWGLLGALMGFGMAFFIPNLNKIKAGGAGLVGGVLGALGFLLALSLTGELAGRLIGATLLGFTIGLVVALVERLAREAALVVHWDPNEQTVINLGPQPVVLGSGSDVHLYLPREKGFPDVTALVTFKNGVVEMDNRLTGKTHTLHGGNKLQIGTLLIEIQTDAQAKG